MFSLLRMQQKNILPDKYLNFCPICKITNLTGALESKSMTFWTSDTLTLSAEMKSVHKRKCELWTFSKTNLQAVLIHFETWFFWQKYFHFIFFIFHHVPNDKKCFCQKKHLEINRGKILFENSFPPINFCIAQFAPNLQLCTRWGNDIEYTSTNQPSQEVRWIIEGRLKLTMTKVPPIQTMWTIVVRCASIS